MKIKYSAPIPWQLAIHNGHSEHIRQAQDEESHSKKILNVFQDDIVVGVLALQGDFLEHIQTLQRLGVNTQEVRLPKDLENINGLIIPGGESTTMANLLDVFVLRELLIKKIQQGMPVWGTCAGAILLAKKLKQDRPTPLGVMDITINRNAFGRQLESFEEELQIKGFAKPLHATFIRAPKIESVGKNVEVLCTLPDGTIVAVKQNNMLATSFHPELTIDTRIHEYFLRMISHSGMKQSEVIESLS